jgi:hypothetical protein
MSKPGRKLGHEVTDDTKKKLSVYKKKQWSRIHQLMDLGIDVEEKVKEEEKLKSMSWVERQKARNRAKKESEWWK